MNGSELLDFSQTYPELFYRLMQEVIGELDLKTVAQNFLRIALDAVSATSGSLAILRGDYLVLAIINLEGKVYENTFLQVGDTLRRGLAGWVLRNRTPALVPDTREDERWLRASYETSRSVISIPIIVKGDNVVGVLTVGHQEAGFFKEKHLTSLLALAHVGGIGLLNALTYSASKQQAVFMRSLARSAAAVAGLPEGKNLVQTILEETRRAAQVETLALARFLPVANSLAITASVGIAADELLGFRFPPEAQDSEQNCAPLERLLGIAARQLACFPVHIKEEKTALLIAVNPSTGIFSPDERQFLQGAADLIGTVLWHSSLFAQLQNAYNQYRELFNDTLEWIFITDLQGKIVEANRCAKESLNYRWEDLRGGVLSITDVHRLPLDLLPEDLTAIPSEPPISYESTAFSKDGRPVPVKVYVRRIIMNSRPHLQWIMRDMTERKRLDQLRNDLLDIIYHDIRSPLGNIVSGVGVLQEECAESETAMGVLGILKRSADSIRRLTDNLLDVGRLESGEAVLNLVWVRPEELISQAVEVVEPTAQVRGHRIVVKVSDGLPEIKCDADMVQRVLINLLDNALKHTPAGGEIEVGAEVHGKDEVMFWVHDDGPGIAPDARERIFDKYTRASTGVRGLGLGLAFCRMAVEAHGGKIGVESEPGDGSKFYFTLPIEAKPR